MRRNQSSAHAQVRHNLALNPSCSANTGGYLTTRTNYCINPGLEAQGGSAVTVRTNLCTSPRGVYAYPGYNGEVNQTITPNVAITGHPLGFTTANRVEYTTGSNPGVTLVNPLVAGTTYSISAWVYHESTTATPGSAAFAQAGVQSQPNPPAIQTGVWTKHTWTYTASGTSQLGFRVSSQSGTGTASFLITGVCAEVGPEAGDFFDGATIRANLAQNPTLDLSTTNWGNYPGAGATSGGSLVSSGGYHGSNFYRVTWTSTQATPASGGGYSDATVEAGNIISASMAVRPSRDQTIRPRFEWVNPTKTGQVGSTQGTDTFCPAGVWTILKLENATVPAGAGYARFTAYSSIAANGGVAWQSGDTLDHDAYMAEVGPSVGPFIASTTGTIGDFTFAWTGTANASTSQQRGVGCPAFGPANQAVVYRTGTPGVAMAARVHFTNNTVGDSGLSIQGSWSGIAASKTWTVSMDVTTDRDRAVKISIQGTGTVPGQVVFNHTAGVKVRRSFTFQTSATGTSGANVAVYLLRADLLMGYVDVDNILIEDNPLALPYFDGNTPAAGDFIYNWSGTAHNSTSRQQALPVVSQVASKNSANLDGKFLGYQTTLADGSKAARWVSPAGTGNSGWKVAGFSSGPGFDYTRIKAGRVYTIWFRYRSFGFGTNNTCGVQISTGGSTNHVIGSTTIYLNQTATPGPWIEYRRSFTALRDADNAQMLYFNIPTVPSPTMDSTIDIRDWGIYEGTYEGDQITGNHPYAKWDGTADASTSRGYPQQLLDIAGAPLLDYTVNTNVEQALPGGFDGNAPRTFYTVGDLFQPPTASVLPLVTYGISGLADSPANGTMLLRFQGSIGVMLNRRTGGAGPISQVTASPARHVAAWGINQDGLQFIQSNGGTTNLSGQVMDTPHQGIRIHADQTIDSKPASSHIRTLMYPGFHDAATRTAIARYLGNKYGANVA